MAIVYQADDAKNKAECSGLTILAIEKIECASGLDDGSDNKGSGGTLKGLIYGKDYEFKVTKFADDYTPSQDEMGEIKWDFSYLNDDGGVTIVTSRENSCDSFILKVNSLDMLGKEISVRAYFSDQDGEGALNVFCHNRFRYFDKSIYENQLRARKNRPELIDQHATSLCGTAAVLYQFALDDSTLFFDSYMEFFVKGETTINSFQLKPNESLYDMKPDSTNKKFPMYTEYSNGTPIVPPDLMRQADWVTLAGTRSSDNKRYEGKKGEDWDAINWPSYMEEACLKLYGATSCEDKTSFITGFDFTDKLKQIENEYNNGWNIILLIDSDMLRGEVSYVGCLTQYHWIVYKGGLSINTTDEKFTFHYWCWQNLYDVHPEKITFKKRVFNTNFYGYIKYKK